NRRWPIWLGDRQARRGRPGRARIDGLAVGAVAVVDGWTDQPTRTGRDEPERVEASRPQPVPEAILRGDRDPDAAARCIGLDVGATAVDADVDMGCPRDLAPGAAVLAVDRDRVERVGPLELGQVGETLAEDAVGLETAVTVQSIVQERDRPAARRDKRSALLLESDQRVRALVESVAVLLTAAAEAGTGEELTQWVRRTLDVDGHLGRNTAAGRFAKEDARVDGIAGVEAGQGQRIECRPARCQGRDEVALLEAITHDGRAELALDHVIAGRPADDHLPATVLFAAERQRDRQVLPGVARCRVNAR